jgi:RNA polymerase sigma-70 factor, ECF subfamily
MATVAHLLPAATFIALSRSHESPINRDLELVQAARCGDRSAFETLVDIHGPAVLRLAWRMTHSEQDANDIYQNTFLKALTAIKGFRGDAAFKSWIYRIATNFCIALLRERSGRSVDSTIRRTDEEGTFDLLDHVSDDRPGSDPEHQLLSGEVGERINLAIGTLTPRERAVFHLKHYEGLKLREIGSILNTTEETAKNTLFRATQKLRSELADLQYSQLRD